MSASKEPMLVILLGFLAPVSFSEGRRLFFFTIFSLGTEEAYWKMGMMKRDWYGLAGDGEMLKIAVRG